MPLPRAPIDLARRGAWSAETAHAPRVPDVAVAAHRRAQPFGKAFSRGVASTSARASAPMRFGAVPAARPPFDARPPPGALPEEFEMRLLRSAPKAECIRRTPGRRRPIPALAGHERGSTRARERPSPRRPSAAQARCCCFSASADDGRADWSTGDQDDHTTTTAGGLALGGAAPGRNKSFRNQNISVF